LALVFVLAWSMRISAAEPLHERIDALIHTAAKDAKLNPPADDAPFLRRVYLDLAGRIPSTTEARAFLQDTTPDKRAKLIDQLLNGPDYPRRMADLWHVMLMERLGDHPEWTKYLRTSFEQNKPWDQLSREILAGTAADEATRGAVFFYAKRLENYGQNPVDYPALTRDVGRLFLGKDFRCAQCHDHLFIDDYKQHDFQGLFAFFHNTALGDAKLPSILEKPTTQKIEFASVFTKVNKTTGPRVPGLAELEVPAFKKGEEYSTPPNAKTKTPGVLKFSPLAKLAETLPTNDNPAFARNAVNRLWFALLGRGLVHPLDLNHKDNPPSHPELLDLLAKEFVAHKYDIKWLLRELALTETYQRSSAIPAGGTAPAPSSFLASLEKRLSAEQLLWSMLEATGMKEAVVKDKQLDAAQQKFVKAFANPRREPEEEFSPSLKAALFVLNDETVLSWLSAKDGNLVQRLDQLGDEQVADELYLAILTRTPIAEERGEVTSYLAKHKDRRATALGHLAWALLASTEFCVNH
jgi:hypothetical protein